MSTPNLHAITGARLLGLPSLLARAYPAFATLWRSRGGSLSKPDGEPRPWDTWELMALLAGVPPEVALQGRICLQFATLEHWPASTRIGLPYLRDMLLEATESAEDAYLRWVSEVTEQHGDGRAAA